MALDRAGSPTFASGWAGAVDSSWIRVSAGSGAKSALAHVERWKSLTTTSSRRR